MSTVGAISTFRRTGNNRSVSVSGPRERFYARNLAADVVAGVSIPAPLFLRPLGMSG